MRLVLASVGLVTFSVFTTIVVARHGYTGFILLALREPWGLQMLVDLTLALVLFTGWMLADARKHAIASWPYVVATLALGSIGALSYIVHRELARRRRATPRTDLPGSASAQREVAASPEAV
jgi:hypothetical protein